MKNLYRSRKDRVVSGVCGGLGKTFGVDPVIIRFLWVALMLTYGFGVLAYIIAWIIIPTEPVEAESQTSQTSSNKEGRVEIFENQNTQQQTSNNPGKNINLAIGVIIVIVGIFALVSSIFGFGNWILRMFSKAFWPLVLIVIGVFVIYWYSKKKQ
jgi:phage shock protein C